jgi:hypothetical protein
VATGISASQIALNWQASSDPTVTGYNVYEKIWYHSGPHNGHWVYNSVASNLTSPTDTVGGLSSGSDHTYVVTAVNSSGESLYSLPAGAETWIAPSLPYQNYFMLSNGTLSNGPVSSMLGLTTQITLLESGNPLTYSKVSGASNLTINAKTGVVTFTPNSKEVGTVNVTFEASNSLGNVTQSVQFDVAAYPALAKPTLKLTVTSATYNGQQQYAWATAVGSDGKTPVLGSFAFAYNGSNVAPLNAGTYQVLVTFTSGDPNYGNATLLGKFTMAKATPKFGGLTAQTITQNQTPTVFTGSIGAGTDFPTGEYVIVTLAGVSEAATVDNNGNFSVSFDTSGLAVGTYKVTYAYVGDANFKAAPTASSTLKVIPDAPPAVTLDPTDETVSAGDPAVFTAATTGSPTPTVQWQVSTDGGQTWTDITGNTSATTTTLIIGTDLSENGYMYRAVFTNPYGTATTTAATLTVESD